ncbi:MAG TPA: hypothetical protein VN048_13850 [Verrucomicrobiae bacterium]|jgi:hypothetical protein|nr:hypothetical protein [Verrucomicrobiae bacterium]
MKARIAKISLAIAWILFFTGFLILCDCPGWYALAAGFAGIAVWAAKGRTRTWAIVCLVVSVIVVGLNIFAMTRKNSRLLERTQRIEQMQMHGTNSSQSTNAPAP